VRIAITSQGEALQSPVDEHFGRCAHFCLLDLDTGLFESIPNPHKDASSGAGIQAAQLVLKKNVGALLTGHLGPKAARVLEDSDLVLVEGVREGTVQEAVERFRKDYLEKEE
jgi:predicted Fe-Mo cluster-binding NifX family protein